VGIYIIKSQISLTEFLYVVQDYQKLNIGCKTIYKTEAEGGDLVFLRLVSILSAQESKLQCYRWG
jgi:hypothetical protein